MDDLTGTFLLGPGCGRVLIKTGRAGLAARVGHDLTIEITRWSARVFIPNGGADTTVTAELDLGSLAVREGTGGAKPLTDSDRGDIVKTARKILGTGTASFASTRVIAAASGGAASSGPASGGAASGGAVEGTLTLNGESRAVRLEVSSPGPGRYRGGTTVRQTDFGITPYSGFFGALKLRDDVGVEFETDLNSAGRQ